MSPTDDVIYNYLGNERAGAERFDENINPSNVEDIVCRYAVASVADVDAAAAKAAAALPRWAATSLQQRHDVLKKIGDEIASRVDELGTLLAREEGKTLGEAKGEVVRAANVFLFFAAECLRTPAERFASVRPGIEVATYRDPVGVVGIITPWNFPIAIPAWKIAPALAFGNCVVFKPAELVPATANALARIILSAGLPDGTFSLVMGEGAAIGEAIVSHPRIDAISFTGSTATGRKIMAASIAGPSMKKVQLEMGGKNPLIVLDDADIEVALDCAVNGAFYSTGQRCTASSRLIVTKGIYQRFVGQLKERVAGLVIGDALDPKTAIGPVVSPDQLEKDLSYIEIGKSEGATLAGGGGTLSRTPHGHYLAPAIFTDADNTMRISREEIFGPVAVVIPAEGYEEAVAIANDTRYGLVAGICTTSLKHSTDFQRRSEAGIVTVNLPTAGVDYHAPFGGKKDSSYGPREQGRYAVEFYTSVKCAYINP